MLRTLRYGLILTIGVLALPATDASEAAGKDSYWLVSPDLLRQANLKVLWQNQLPFQKTETLEQMLILENRIYALSNKNFLVSLDRHQGTMVFSRPIAPASFAVLGLDVYNDELISVIANRLVELDPGLGTERRGTALQFRVVCPAARNGSYFYVAGTDRRLRALHADNKVQAFEVAAKNDSLINSVIADEKFVVFGTDAGNVVGIAPDRPYQLWQFDAGGAIAGPIVRDGTSFFFASKDTNLYRLDMVDMLTTKLAWKQQMPGILQKEPRVTATAVYQPVLSGVEGYAGGRALTAIDRYSGRHLWSLEQGTDLLAEAAGKAYVITDSRTLVVMDNKQAKKLYVVNFVDVSRYAANTVDSKTYIADSRGRVACLEPIE